jgi:hypothetical protein
MLVKIFRRIWVELDLQNQRLLSEMLVVAAPRDHYQGRSTTVQQEYFLTVNTYEELNLIFGGQHDPRIKVLWTESRGLTSPPGVKGSYSP